MPREPKPLILILEDERELASMVAKQLEVSGMQAQVFNHPANALNFLKKNFANLILLDIKLPSMDGFEFFEELQKNDIEVPVIFLTGNDSEVDKIKGLSMGGDDYITKPFSFAELVARIQAVLRRTEMAKDHNVTHNASLSDEPFDFCGAQVQPQSMQIVFPEEKAEKIGKKELGLLVYFASNPGTVITRKAVIHAVWGMHADIKSRSLDQYLVKLRDHYSRNGLSLDALKTVHGVGFIYEPETETESQLS